MYFYLKRRESEKKVLTKKFSLEVSKELRKIFFKSGSIPIMSFHNFFVEVVSFQTSNRNKHFIPQIDGAILLVNSTYHFQKLVHLLYVKKSLQSPQYITTHPVFQTHILRFHFIGLRTVPAKNSVVSNAPASKSASVVHTFATEKWTVQTEVTKPDVEACVRNTISR